MEVDSSKDSGLLLAVWNGTRYGAQKRRLAEKYEIADRIYIHPNSPSQHIFVMVTNMADQMNLIAKTSPWLAEDIFRSQ